MLRAARTARDPLPIDRYATWRIHRIEPSDITAASELEKRFRESFWDALIILSAARVRAARLVTEDRPHRRRIAGLETVDPFTTARR